MGDDKKERALGKFDAAYMTVVPLWARYMYEAARGTTRTRRSRGSCRRASSRAIAAITARASKGPQMNLIFRPGKKELDRGADERPPV